MCVNFGKSPVDIAEQRVEHIYTGDQCSDIVNGMNRCDPEAELMVGNSNGLITLTPFVTSC